jgi:IS5 family transposase
LAFHLSDSASYRAFVRLPFAWSPSRSTLQACIRAIKPETLQYLNEQLILHWLIEGTANSHHLRIDSTVVNSHITPPSDSQLLSDGIRVLSRLMTKSKDRIGIKLRFTDQRKKAKHLAFKIFNAKNADKEALYPKLLGLAKRVMKQSARSLERVMAVAGNSHAWCNEVQHYQGLLGRVIKQTTRRVINKEKVSSSEKLVSLFEPHTDIIVKGFRDVQYGHKINLATELSGYITHCSIEQGNTSDRDLFLPVLKLHKETYGQIPFRTIADGGYASQKNVQKGRAMGVQSVGFQKNVGLTLRAMGLQQKTLKKLAHFRAGIEGNISELKRAFGCSVAKWKQWSGFQAFVWSSILSYNLNRYVRLNSS